MVLSDRGIKHAIEADELEITPRPTEYPINQYTTSAVDLFLGDEFHIWDRSKLAVPGVRVELNLVEQQYARTVEAYRIPAPRETDGSVILAPYQVNPWHLLGITREHIWLKPGSRLAARIEGRSSLARIGLMVHFTAPTIHALFKGKIALEMINFGPFYLKLIPNRTIICQLVFERLEAEPGLGEPATAFQGQQVP